MTLKTPGIHRITPTNWVEVSPELAQERGMTSGTKVEVERRWGVLRAKVLVTDRVQSKELYMPMNSVEEPGNRLTGAHVDRATHTPAYRRAHPRSGAEGTIAAGSRKLPQRQQDAAKRRRGGAQMGALGLLRSRHPQCRPVGADQLDDNIRTDHGESHRI